MSSQTDAPAGALSEIDRPDPSTDPSRDPSTDPSRDASTGGAAPVRAARSVRAPEVPLGQERWPSLVSRAGGWTWQTDPEDVLLPVDDGRRSRNTDPQVVRAVVWSRILIG